MARFDTTGDRVRLVNHDALMHGEFNPQHYEFTCSRYNRTELILLLSRFNGTLSKRTM